jgi:hypothetical protein
MPVSILRQTLSGFTVIGLLASGAVSASAQTSQEPLGLASITSNVSLTANVESPFASTERALTASVVNPRPNVSFMPVQGGGSDDSGIGFGIMGMLSRTNWRAEGFEDFFEDSDGYGVGLWVGGNRNGVVGFVGEFMYLRRGDDEFTSHAIQIPAVFHVNLGTRSTNGAGVYLIAGPSFTINLKQELDGLDISDDFAGADIGVIGGVGVEFYRIGLEGRVNWGLRNIDNTGTFDDLKTRTYEFVGKFAFN